MVVRMHDISYVEQSHNDLRYAFLEGSVNVEQYTVLKEEHFKREHFECSFGVLGASHFVSLTLPTGTMVHELCACVPIEPEESAEYISGMLFEVGEFQKDIENLHYTFSSRVYEIQEGLDYFDTKKGTEDTFHSLSYTFPGEEGAVHQPKTTIFAIEKSDGIHIATIHTYPNEQKAVVTESVFNIILE